MATDNNTVALSDSRHYLVNDNLRIIAKGVNLGVVGHASDWREVTKTEAEKLKKEWEKDEN